MFGSLFDFARDIGARLFTSDAEAAVSILRHIEANNPGVNPLDVKYDDGCVTLRGQANSVAAREKCILIAGNVRGVEKVVADELTIARKPAAASILAQAPSPSATPVVALDPAPAPPAAAPEAEAPSRFYVIQKGDTLWKIAAGTLGKGARYAEIFEANREVILHPDKIYPGQKIRIPAK
jgi:nucleoid-associated protein YgaU